MPPTLTQFITALEKAKGHAFNTAQRDALAHGDGPLWILAGPGTGKTELLVARCLKLICVEGVDPKSILVTTFTEKASLNLQQRIADTLGKLHRSGFATATVDASGLRIGTLHGLCNDLMQEYRHEPYRNLRLLDDVETAMLIRGRVAKFAKQQLLFLKEFSFLFPEHKPQLSLWDITKGIIPLLNRLVEDDLDYAKARTLSAGWAEAVLIAEEYERVLAEKYSCDFARLQRHFLQFLATPSGGVFLNGDPSNGQLPLRYVLIDEYQDTNPVQEQIYFALAPRPPHNIAVVGDDDQALYRFRGGSVDSMIEFGSRCRTRWKKPPAVIQLRENYRSHKAIVDWCNDYISGFPRMRVAGARAPGKKPLLFASGQKGAYPAVGFIREGKLADLATAFASTVQGLVREGIVDDYSQCVLLLRSTKDGLQSAGPYISALRQAAIPIYNPRSKSFVEQEDVQTLLGCLIAVLDPGGLGAAALLGDDLQQTVAACLAARAAAERANPALAAYIRNASAAVATLGLDEQVTPAVPTILFRILTCAPFPALQKDPEADLRLSKVSRLLEAFCAQYGRRLSMDKQVAGQVSGYWISQFFYVFFGYLSTFGVDDDEEDDAVAPIGRLPLMTFHQAKGLEFDFVFVATLGKGVEEGQSIELEDKGKGARRSPIASATSVTDRAWHDAIRAHYVAFSRARHSLVLLATNQQFKKTGDETASFGATGGVGFQRAYVRL